MPRNKSGSANGGVIGKVNNSSFGKNTQTVKTSSGTLTTQPGTRLIDAVTVGGGAGGGNNTGGGGGAGQVLTQSSLPISGPIAITIGGGGAGSSSPGSPGVDGTATSIPGIPSSSPAAFGVKGLGQAGTTFSGGASGSGNAGGIGYKQTPGGASAPGGTGGGAFTDTRMVRVPRHMLGLNTYYKIPNKKISFNLQTIGATDARDYGNFNSPLSGTDYADVKLPAYFVNHLTMNYDYIPGYDVFCKITNLTSEDYHTVLHYSQPQRAFSCGMKKSFD